MAHNPNAALMGDPQSSVKEVSNRNGTVEAGLGVEIKSDGSIAAGLSTGGLLGISLGADLSSIGRTSILHKGLKVPVKLASGFTPAIGAQVFIEKATGLAKATDTTNTQATAAVYVTSKLSTGGLAESGTYVACALVDMIGGL